MMGLDPSTTADRAVQEPATRSVWRAGLWNFLAIQAGHYLEACPPASTDDLVNLREAIWLMNCRASLHHRAAARRAARHHEAQATGRHLASVREPSRTGTR